MKKLHIGLLLTMLVFLTAVGILSFLPLQENSATSEQPATAPQLTLASLADGSFTSSLEDYDTQQFPFRQALLSMSQVMNRFYAFSGSGEDSVLVLDGNTGAENGGESLTQVENALGLDETERVTEGAEASSEKAEETPQTSDAAAEETESTPAEEVSEEDVSYAGSVVIVGTRAMEVPNAQNEIIDSYADAVNEISSALGSDMRVISLLTPNGAEFYAPESLRTGIHSQKDMIDRCYAGMSSSILTVDAYSSLQTHADDYIFFRTDHHWTQLGAYYAYLAFCDAADFTPVTLDAYTSGSYENFVGSMYTFTKGYAQSEVLKDNPDTLTYYLPATETHAKIYSDATLTDGMAVSVVYTKLSESVSNKYLCYIGGDEPVCVIDTAADGPTCILLKESYGNAFVPFLACHYRRIITIDPREFNADGKPSLDLRTFASEQGADDIIVLNYPYMINSSSYVKMLKSLVE